MQLIELIADLTVRPLFQKKVFLFTQIVTLTLPNPETAQKSAGQDPHCFLFCLLIHTKKLEFCMLIGCKFGRSVVHYNIKHDKG